MTDNRGRVAAFNPVGPSHMSLTTISDADAALLSASCVSATECVAITEFEQVLTFNPLAPALATPMAIDRTSNETATGLIGISCTSASQCVVLDFKGQELTLNPQAVGNPKPTPVAGGKLLFGLDCVAATSCVALGQKGTIVTFDPTAPGHVVSAKPAHGPFADTTCPTPKQCSVVARPNRIFTFDPGSVSSGSVATERRPAHGH